MVTVLRGRTGDKEMRSFRMTPTEVARVTRSARPSRPKYRLTPSASDKGRGPRVGRTKRTKRAPPSGGRAGVVGLARCDARTPPDSPTESLGRLQPQLLPQMPEPRRVHRAGIEHKLAQGGEARFGQEGGIADPSRPDFDQTAVEHGLGGWRQLGLALLRAGFPAPEEDAVGDVRWGAEMDTEFLAQPGAFGWGEGRGRGLGAGAHRRQERPNRL